MMTPANPTPAALAALNYDLYEQIAKAPSHFHAWVIRDAILALLAAARQGEDTAKPESEWHEDFGAALWWVFHPHTGQVYEPPYVGTPLDDDWPGYHTHWTRIPVPAARAASQPEEGSR